ncbi:unnamed protein product [Clonostachys rosea f. rosea IK726]|uniref:Uncharacterized protein n=1 Tax=Clonostachys rosea f. rosea IK726 TaxID=1349383 RepID=A0ACA9TJC2_BIOOC|nr:unnamed protein product [Clonostachys rosea f. rosea IK726]
MEDRRYIIISIHPKYVANIVSREKNHEFRNYLLPASVKRLWIYETSPLSSIRYIATISQGKRPGEICNPDGLENDEFDRGDLEGSAKYLPASYSLSDLKRKGWLKGAPQKYCFLKPAMREAASTLPLRLVFGPDEQTLDLSKDVNSEEEPVKERQSVDKSLKD